MRCHSFRGRKGYNIETAVHTVLICVCVLVVLFVEEKKMKKNININMVGCGNG